MNTPLTLHRLLLLTLALGALFLTGCSDAVQPTPAGDDNNGGGDQQQGPAILVLGDGGSEVHVKATLTAAGFTVTDGGLFHEFTGAGLDAADAVVLLAGVDYNHDMNDQGESALVAFVGAGGGLLTTEWLSYCIERQDYHQILQTVLPVHYAGSYATGGETMTVMVDHPVTENLPATFTTNDRNQYSVVGPKSGATQLVRGSRSGHAVVTWTRGGRVVSLNMAGEYGDQSPWNAGMDQLLADAVGFVSKK